VSNTVIPVTTYVATTAPLGDRLAQAITYTGAVSDTQRADSHYRIVNGDRLMWGGRMTTWSSDPQKMAPQLVADIARIYPQLADVPIEYAWSGEMAFAVHKMPQIGEVTPGIWLASAFGGHGINTTAMAGMLVARGLVDGDDTWRLFLPYELIWAGGIGGRAAAQIAYWVRRTSESVAMRSAQRREAERRSEVLQPRRRGGIAPADPMIAPMAEPLAAPSLAEQLPMLRRAERPPFASEPAPPQAPVGDLPTEDTLSTGQGSSRSLKHRAQR
jgi:gamma-glutamylputrescine oxidase